MVRALNQCAFPTCRQSLTEDSLHADTGETLTNPIGEQAHIRSYKTSGPRYDAEYPKEKLHEVSENLILLRPTHHQMVDANNGAAYTVADLVAMRETHERKAKRKSELDSTINKYAQRSVLRVKIRCCSSKLT